MPPREKALACSACTNARKASAGSSGWYLAKGREPICRSRCRFGLPSTTRAALRADLRRILPRVRGRQRKINLNACTPLGVTLKLQDSVQSLYKTSDGRESQIAFVLT